MRVSPAATLASEDRIIDLDPTLLDSTFDTRLVLASGSFWLAESYWGFPDSAPA